MPTEGTFGVERSRHFIGQVGFGHSEQQRAGINNQFDLLLRGHFLQSSAVLQDNLLHRIDAGRIDLVAEPLNLLLERLQLGEFGRVLLGREFRIIDLLVAIGIESLEQGLTLPAPWYDAARSAWAKVVLTCS